MAKLRVALAITDLDVGGAERCLVDLATRLDPARFEPVVYCLGRRPSQGGDDCAQALEAGGIGTHYLDGQGLWSLFRVLRRLKRLLANQSPDLIQTSLFHANLIGRIAARCAGVRRVVAGIRVAERRSLWHLWLDRITHRWVDRYVCVSQAVARFSTEHGGLPEHKLVVIPNGIDLDRYPAPAPATPESLGIPPGRRLVVCVGRLEPQKGVRWLIETTGQWLPRLPDCDLVVVGKGPQRPELEAVCRGQGMVDRVHFVGWRREVPEILAASHLLVLPSRWEGMPNVVLQAMASGLPVVATDVEGVRELLGPDADCQVVNYADTQSLANSIVSILSQPQRAADLGRRNRLRAETHFGLQRMVSAYEDLWQSLVGCDTSGSPMQA